MNQVLDISLEKICLFLLKVVASLPRHLLVDALGKTSWLDKPPHHVKVGFIEGDCLRVLPLVYVSRFSNITIYFFNIVFTNDANFRFCRVKKSAFRTILKIFLMIFKCNKGLTLVKLFSSVIWMMAFSNAFGFFIVLFISAVFVFCMILGFCLSIICYNCS